MAKKYHYFTICTWCTLTWQIYIIRISLRKELAKTTTLPTPRHKSITHNSTSSKKNIIHRFTGSSLHLHSYCPWVLDPWPMGAIRQWSWVHVTIRWDELRRARPPALCLSLLLPSHSLSSSPPGKHRLFFLFLTLLFLSLCVGSTHNLFSLPRFLLSSFGDGPRNLTGTPPLQEPSTAALVGSILFGSLLAIALPVFLDLAVLVGS